MSVLQDMGLAIWPWLKRVIPFHLSSGEQPVFDRNFLQHEEASSVLRILPESTQPSLLEVELVPPALERTPNRLQNLCRSC
jgi:hypothetical protein